MDINDDGPVATWTLDAPPANSIGEAAVAQMRASLDRLTMSGHPARVLLIESTGKLFSAGVDLELVKANMTDPDGGDKMVDFISRVQEVYADIEALAIPTICVMSGSALGGGLEFALACDLRIAADDAVFGLPEILLGLLPGAGGTQRLPRIVGTALATRLILRGETLTGQEALAAGLVQWSVPRDETRTLGRDLANELAGRSPLAVGAIKAAIRLSPQGGSAGYQLELDTTRSLMADPIARSEVIAFFQKRDDARRQKEQGARSQ